MSFFDDVRKLTQPYNGDDEQYFADELEPDDEPTVVASRREAAPQSESVFERKRAPEQEVFAQQPHEVVYESREAVEMSKATVNVETVMKIVTMRPERYEQMPAIADRLIDHCAVLVNLESAPKETARRIVDFLAGASYTVGGAMTKVAINTYIVTPNRISDLNRLMDELENKGIRFY